MELNLLEKKELWVENICLNNTNLNKIADVVATLIDVPRDRVLVVDVRENHITLDILTQSIKAESIVGKEKEIIDGISKIEGVQIFENTCIHSEGILGLISLDKDNTPTIISDVENITNEIKEKVSKRAIVFPTGFEVKNNIIEDTNTPHIIKSLQGMGFNVEKGDVIDDDIDLITGRLRQAINSGYGLVITSGGVGAEDKDKTVEAIERLDKSAATPYIIKFKKGTGRHVKEGVRIGVGKVGRTLIVALPGPNDEVRIGIDMLKNHLETRDKEEIANNLASALKDKLVEKLKHNSHFHGKHN